MGKNMIKEEIQNNKVQNREEANNSSTKAKKKMFKTKKGKKIISLQDTDWFKEVKFTYDNKEEKTK